MYSQHPTAEEEKSMEEEETPQLSDVLGVQRQAL